MATKKEKSIVIKNVSVKYGDFVALKAMNFDVAQGEMVAILGPNGSGKSSLIKAMMGLVSYEGSISILGKDPLEGRTAIGYVPQRFQIDSSMPITVHEFLAMSQINGADHTACMSMLYEVGLEKKKDALVGTLSGGQLQRVLIARSLLNDPQILILDEPEAGIDPEAERNMYDLIKHINKKHNVTVIMVSHDIDVIFDFADTVICVNKKMVCHGVPADILTSKNIDEIYGGGMLHHKH